MRSPRAGLRFVVGAFAAAFAYASPGALAQPISAARAPPPPPTASPPPSTSETPPPRPTYEIPPGAFDALNQATSQAATPGANFPAGPSTAPCPPGTLRTRSGCTPQRPDGPAGPATSQPANPQPTKPPPPAGPPGIDVGALTPFPSDNAPEPTATRPSPANTPHAPAAAPTRHHPTRTAQGGQDGSRPPATPPSTSTTTTQPPASAPPQQQQQQEPQQQQQPQPKWWQDWKVYAAAAGGAAAALGLAKLLVRPVPKAVLRLRPTLGVLRTSLRFTRRRRGSLIAVRAIRQPIRITAHPMGRPT